MTLPWDIFFSVILSAAKDPCIPRKPGSLAGSAD